MDMKQVGSLAVSVIGIGCNSFGSRIDQSKTTEVVHAALDVGINFFDTADTYGPRGVSEEFIGKSLTSRRSEAVIATKFGSPFDETHFGAKPEYIRYCVENSLRRLRVDYIDLFQLHRPDPTTPIADTLGALNQLVEQGKVREIGCSKFSVAQLREATTAIPAGGVGFVSVQNEYSLLNRAAEIDVLRECEETGLAFLPFFPLQSGMLTGKYHRGADVPTGTRLAGANAERRAELLSDRNFDIVEALDTFAEDRGHSLLELALARLIAWPSIASVIAGATSKVQVLENAAAANWHLSVEESAEIDRLSSAA
jgi:aryl-alcohol dehydrogenase-like predicted oxidoreductase